MTDASHAIPVTPENFARAETDLYLGNVVRDGGFGKFQHHREPVRIDHQIVVRPNRDTLYSVAVFDLDAGPVTITLPDAGRRFLSMQIVDEDEYAYAVTYGAGRHVLTKEKIGTRYALAAVRILVDANDPADVKQVNALQDALVVAQGAPGRFEVPVWDSASQAKVREALLALGETVPDTKRMFGPRGDVDPVRHLIGVAAGWGGNPEKDAYYLFVAPPQNDGTTVHRLTVKDVPVDGFWSVSVYNAAGYFEPNALGINSLNDLTAKPNGDGSTTIQFGGCNDIVPNCIPIMPRWNYTVRLYRPRPEVLNGTWTFPTAQPV